MSQSATKLVKDALERKMKAAESDSGESPDSWESPESQGSTTMTRSELETLVREAVQEGLAEYHRESDQGETGRSSATDDDEESTGSQDDDSSSGGKGLGGLLVLGLLGAAVLYLRRRSRDDDTVSDY